MVVIDNTVVQFHGEDNTELFILAMFNMVRIVYGHLQLDVLHVASDSLLVKIRQVKLTCLHYGTAVTCCSYV